METVCQACGYQRKPTDQAPDWECPSCGKAYVKTSQASPSPLVIYTDTSSAEANKKLHGGTVYRREPKETAKNKYGILIGALFLLLIFGLPILFDPSAASDIILHSNRGFIALICTALLTALAIAGRMSARGGPDGRKSSVTFAATSIGLALVALFFGLAISWHNEAHTEAKIQRNGLPAMADVIRVYTGECGRGGCSIYVEYAFTPPSETKSMHGHAWLGSRNTDPNVVYARTQKKVPIAYEVGHPEVSALNFNDDVFRLDHGEHDHGGAARLGKLFLLFFALVLAIAGLGLWLRPSKKLDAN